MRLKIEYWQTRCLTFYPTDVLEIKMEGVFPLTTSITSQAELRFFCGFLENTYCGQKKNHSVKRFKGPVQGLQHSNNLAACVRQNVTLWCFHGWNFQQTKGQMNFFITFEVGYIFSPKCPLLKAKNNAWHIHKTVQSLLSGIHKKL